MTADVGHAEGFCRTHIVEVAAAQKFGPDDAGEVHPAEQQQEGQQDPEAGRDHAAEDDQQIELRHVGPDLDEALEQQVDRTAVEPLDRAGEDADDRRDDGEREAEQDREAEAVDHAGEDVARLVVGAEQVAPARRGGGRDRQAVDQGVVAERNERPDHPAMPVDGAAHVWVLVVGFGGQEVGSEPVLAVVLENREIPVVVEGGSAAGGRWRRTPRTGRRRTGW